MDDTTTINGTLIEILQRLARIEEGMKTEQERCPYRENIARAMNSITERKALALRVDALEEQVVETRISIARLLATGGIGGVAGTLLVELIKAIAERI